MHLLQYTQTTCHVTCCVGRPIGSGTCGNLRDASTLVTSVGMCASYAWSNGKNGFCLLKGSQCFTSDSFQDDYASAVQTNCTERDVMTCYMFVSAQRSVSRSNKGIASAEYSASDIAKLRNSLAEVSFGSHAHVMYALIAHP
jgi:hypothetical protein